MPISLEAFDKQLISVVDKVKGCIVNVSTVRMMQDSFMHLHPIKGIGTGVIIDDTGYIVTNYHVIEGAEEVIVTLSDGRKPSGEVIGVDPSTDLALIKVNAKNIKSCKLGDSEKIKVGQMAIAIGNPFGIVLDGPTVTVGVISALKRTIQAKNNVYENLIQTDASINPGNSGGALLDIRGKLVGINSATIKGAQGIGFAIPINVVKEVVDDLIKFGKVRRSWMGIIGLTNSKQVAKYYNLPTDQGVITARIAANGPAHIAGIIPGDILLKMEGKVLKSMKDIQSILKAKKPGDKIKLSILSQGKELSLEIKLSEPPQ